MNSTLLRGLWIGESVNADAQMSWELHLNETWGRAVCRESGTACDVRLSSTPATFMLGEACAEFFAHFLDDAHLVIFNWDKADDAVFSRPGLPELTAHDCYARMLDSGTLQEPHFTLSRWPTT